MKKMLMAYKDLILIFWKGKKRLVLLCVGIALLSGLLEPVLVFINQNILNKGIEVAKGNYLFKDYIIYLFIFVICSILSQIIIVIMNLYVYPESQLFLRTDYKKKMLMKLKKIEYKHFENKSSMEIIDKAYSQAEEAALHLFPRYIFTIVTSTIGLMGILIQLCQAAWWISLTLIIPYIIETYLIYKNNFDIYQEMETYWNRERQYTILGNFLKERDTTRENRLNQATDYLIDTYKERLHSRNREYEDYYFIYLKKIISNKMISKATQIVNALILLYMFFSGKIDIGQLISYTMAIFAALWSEMDGIANVIKWSGHHINFYDYYHQYFNLSEDAEGKITEVPQNASIEFRNVSFRYPNTDKIILERMSFTIKSGEKISIVGENGEGKTTIIKLLLGLYRPDAGEILIAGKNINEYSEDARVGLFGTVFQDFNKYAVSLKENIGIGIEKNTNKDISIKNAIKKAKIDDFISKLPQAENTLLTRNFTGGVDLSGGEWQRVALARAIVGEKPILILDEPTSQLDPVAESKLYSEFAEMSKGKTTIFITHRLASTMITDRILVISKGRIVQEGTHQELLDKGGIYADMFQSQKQWYVAAGE